MSNDDFYDHWRKCVVTNYEDYDRMTDDELQQAFLWTTRHGPPNCWTGTIGHAAMLIRRLLAEVLRHESAT
jgi:hypothetical protein